jgi:hypothetical protein
MENKTFLASENEKKGYLGKLSTKNANETESFRWKNPFINNLENDWYNPNTWSPTTTKPIPEPKEEPVPKPLPKPKEEPVLIQEPVSQLKVEPKEEKEPEKFMNVNTPKLKKNNIMIILLLVLSILLIFFIVF